ncbi:MAG: hypothetical protein HY903_13620 [Deltaproteobacteria bacterium]|nr:hypothetical protein [Deltaproteobacteria bacterium]
MRKLVLVVFLSLPIGPAAFAADEDVAAPPPEGEAIPASAPAVGDAVVAEPLPAPAAPVAADAGVPAPPAAADAGVPAAPPSAPAPAGLTLFRLDMEDGFAVHPWIYREERLNDRWGVLFDLTFQAPGMNDRLPPYAELDVGPVLHLGDLSINPQVGIDCVWQDGAAGGRSRFADVLAELYLIYSTPKLNAESWNLYFFPLRNGDPQLFQMRQLVTVHVIGGLGLGPHVEATWIRGVGVDRAAFGGDLAYAGDWGQVLVFLADESKRDRMEMRLTYLKAL